MLWLWPGAAQLWGLGLLSQVAAQQKENAWCTCRMLPSGGMLLWSMLTGSLVLYRSAETTLSKGRENRMSVEVLSPNTHVAASSVWLIYVTSFCWPA